MLSRRTNRLRWYFDHNDGRLIHKWLHYFPIYERSFAPFRGRECTLLEIGVSHGGSLQMWRAYLGRRSRIVGIDIEPRVAELAEEGIDIHVGSQSDTEFLARLVAEYGTFDLVIDDGSHAPSDQIASIEYLWPYVAIGGCYVVEDLHSNYWPEYGAGRGQDHTFMAWLSERIDDMHAFHSREPGFEPNLWTNTLGAIHVYDSIAVLDKAQVTRPEHRKTGRPAFADVYGIEFHDVVDEQHLAQLRSLSSPMARLRRARHDPRGSLARAWSRVRR
jgi:hypothetical protein